MKYRIEMIKKIKDNLFEIRFTDKTERKNTEELIIYLKEQGYSNDDIIDIGVEKYQIRNFDIDDLLSN